MEDYDGSDDDKKTMNTMGLLMLMTRLMMKNDDADKHAGEDPDGDHHGDHDE